MLSRRMTTILSAVVLIAAAGGAFGLTDLRFWAWRSDVREVSKDFYGLRVSQTARRLELARDELDACRRREDACWRLVQQLSDRELEHARVLEALQRLGE